MALEDTDVYTRLERFYDAVPRDAAVVEDIGGFVLFVNDGWGWPYYARPRLGGAETPSAADITAVRRRQRELGVPEAFEWVHETTPDLLAVARSAGLDVLLAPLMVLESAALVPDLPLPGATIRFLDPASATFAQDISISRAVGRLGFGAPANATAVQTGSLAIEVAGPAQRDAVPPLSEEAIAQQVRRHASGRFVSAVVESPADGILACGAVQRVESVAEIAGVATLPSARRRGYASQLTASLARRTLLDGSDLVLLSAGDDDVARLYSKVGFRRIGTACIAEPAAAAI
ncbi:GNAT family N-acetyltransferase [Actinoplanes friuliensis]|uniref:Putative GCN5-related N-acetyltransferase n=1 Tax=Actinoplanes friuliensis DSM 7358 TaxID=1246995 RepID=U5VX99_9ACTN|nr:GNAT family N-acetyltransferase [Actinoplanes friuliensis]AGZ40355.1 putative GCN5-related N-acetyltransferase [Actinoplanes friuliensis DSM 7358]